MPGSHEEQEEKGVPNAAMNAIAYGALSSPLLSGQQILDIHLKLRSKKNIEQEIEQLLKQPPPQELVQERQQQLQIIILQLQKELLEKELQEMKVSIQCKESDQQMRSLMPQQQQQQQQVQNKEQLEGLKREQGALKLKILEQQQIQRQIQQQLGLPTAQIPRKRKLLLPEEVHKKMSPEEQLAHEILDAVGPVLAASFETSAIVLMKMAEQKGIKLKERGLKGPVVLNAIVAERHARFNNKSLIKRAKGL